MGTPLVTSSPEPPAWRKQAQALEARALWYMPRSRRGRLRRVYIVRACTGCGEAHQFLGAGTRTAPCRAVLNIKGRKGRSR